MKVRIALFFVVLCFAFSGRLLACRFDQSYLLACSITSMIPPGGVSPVLSRFQRDAARRRGLLGTRPPGLVLGAETEAWWPDRYV